MLNLVLLCLTCNNIMHILPLPLCGLYSICVHNGYGQHRPCKFVLLALVAPRGVTDLYLSWIHIEHARTAYHETCGTEYQQQYRRCNSQTPYYKWNMAQARPMSVSYVPRSLQSWVSTTHRSYSQLTFFNIFNQMDIAQARPMSVSDAPSSLQSWVSTTHRSCSQLTFSIFWNVLTVIAVVLDTYQVIN